MANPKGIDPIPNGYQPISPAIKIGLARNIVNQSAFAGVVNLNGRFDLKGPVYRGDTLSPQFLLRPILRRMALQPQAQRGGVVTELRTQSPNATNLERVRNNAR